MLRPGSVPFPLVLAALAAPLGACIPAPQQGPVTPAQPVAEAQDPGSPAPSEDGEVLGALTGDSIDALDPAEPRRDPVAIDGQDPACSDGLSCAKIGRDFEFGQNGVPRDATKALAYYLKACDFNEKTGCNNYGYMILNGMGATPDQRRGLAYLQKACDLGSGAGCHNLGFAYENSQGVAHDMSVAVELFRKSCTLGQASGCRAVGLCYHFGLGLTKDPAQAVHYLRQGCAGGDAVGCEKLRELGVTP
jgi:hypothetical protein